MKKRSKLIAIILTIVMVTALLCACGGTAPATATTPAQTDNTAEASAPETEIPAESGIAWPEKPITVVVPGAAGGGTDQTCRMIQKYLEEELGTQIIVSNIKGGACSLGSTEVYNSAPDGYTMLYLHEDMITMNVLGVTDFGFRDFEIAGRCYDVDAIGILANKKYTTMDDLKTAADNNPGEVSFAIDTGTITQMVPYMIESAMGVELKLVDGGNLAERIPLMLSGQLDFTFAPLGNVKDYLANGDINCIGILSAERSELVPDIPTCTEQGYDLVSKKFFNFYFPAGTPEEIVAKFSDALEKACSNEEFQKEAAATYFKVSYGTPDEARAELEETEVMFNKYKDQIIEVK